MIRATSVLESAGAEDSDEALVHAAKADPAEFAAIYGRYRLPIFRYLRARGETEDCAADLAAVTFERALRALPHYRSRGGGLAAWLFRIARNAALDEHKRRARSGPGATDLILSRLPTPGPADATEIRLAVNALPPVEREAVLLRYSAGLTSREIGAVIGKSAEATQKLIERALHILKEDLR
ncbi:MAG: RNA polymerase sigma factor [Chloroflexota bacterium]|nr:RNA polymerase sigma factor [Chloroflexota bacterium]